MNILDSGPLTAGGVLGVLGLALKLALELVKRGNRKRLEGVSKVPPSPQLQPPQTDPHVLRRMDVADYESALSVALVRERGVVDDLRRELAETRAERDRLVVELRASRALVERLRAEIRARRARGAIEVSAAEYRDASQPGELQDAIRTPLRPPKP